MSMIKVLQARFNRFSANLCGHLSGFCVEPAFHAENAEIFAKAADAPANLLNRSHLKYLFGQLLNSKCAF